MRPVEKCRSHGGFSGRNLPTVFSRVLKGMHSNLLNAAHIEHIGPDKLIVWHNRYERTGDAACILIQIRTRKLSIFKKYVGPEFAKPHTFTFPASLVSVRAPGFLRWGARRASAYKKSNFEPC